MNALAFGIEVREKRGFFKDRSNNKKLLDSIKTKGGLLRNYKPKKRVKKSQRPGRKIRHGIRL